MFIRRARNIDYGVLRALYGIGNVLRHGFAVARPVERECKRFSKLACIDGQRQNDIFERPARRNFLTLRYVVDCAVVGNRQIEQRIIRVVVGNIESKRDRAGVFQLGWRCRDGYVDFIRARGRHP
ncbi:hypothetical protein SDC9_158573 [bioreactor metagenome]|uniref:Uncharacterized protein n=1 Tax=bioreactor metagenome TaxID=1076179 RepID=A0A645FCG7_9ZZZZ